MKISLMRDFRFLTLLSLLALSSYAVLSPYVFKQSGIVVAFSNNTCVKDGDVITRFEGLGVASVQDFMSFEGKIKQNQTVTITVNNLPRSCVPIKDGSLGLAIKEVSVGNLKFGIDIEGGSRVLLKPKNDTTPDKISEAIGTLNQRINFYGLRDIRVAPVGQNLIQIEVAGSSGDDIRNFLARQGKFEGKIAYNVQLAGNAGKFNLGGSVYEVKLDGKAAMINGEEHGFNETFVLQKNNFKIVDFTNTSLVIHGDLFTGEDITAVLTDPQFSRVVAEPTGGYQFYFTVQISKESSSRFALLTKNQPYRVIGNERYIDPKLDLFLDGQIVSSLNVAANLAGQETTSATIQGFSETRDGAFKEKLKLETILRSGSLPVELEIVKVDTITQTAGREFIDSTLIVILGAALSVSLIIFIRYRKIKIALPMILISFSEIFVVLGFAALTNMLTGGGGWVLDIPAIAGLIAIIGTGVNQLIIITDQMLLEKDQAVSFRRKTAMSMILNSAYIVMAAMIPLIILGIGTLRGFAITTIVGVLIAILVTRPAYTAILKRIEHLEG